MDDKTLKVSVGVPGLDDVLLGGLPQDRLYLIEGNPGSGKTTLALAFLLEGARRGEPTLFVSLSETAEEIREVAKSHDWDISQITLFELRAPEDPKQAETEDYTFFHPSEIELGHTLKNVFETIRKVKPHRVVFDSLSEFRLLAHDPLRYRRQILALKQFFVGKHCTVLLLDDRTSDLRDLQLYSLSHGVITLEQLSPEYGAERRRMKITKLRGSSYRGGYHDMIIKKGGVVVFPRLIAAEHREWDFKQLPALSGVSALDTLLGGGLSKGSSTLLIGPSGSGKSTVSTQYAMAALERGERVVLYAFDEGIQALLTRSAGVGMDLIPYLKSEQLCVEHIDPAELTPGEFTNRVRISVEERKVSMVVVDSLNGYMHAMPEERFLVLQMHELLSYLNQKGIVTVLVAAQHGLLGTKVDTSLDISYLADTVVLFRYFEYDGEVRRAISVVKKRTGQHEKTIREMKIGLRGISVEEPTKDFQGVLSGIPTLIKTEGER